MSAPNNQKDAPVTVTAEDVPTKSILTSTQSPTFEDAFNEHWNRVYEVLFRIVGEQAEAEDLALETFWRLYDRPPKVESREKLAGWLYRVATNLGFNSLRARNRRSRYEEEAGHLNLESHSSPDPALEVERLEEIQRVRQILSLMKPRNAKLLVLRNSGFTYAELAVILGVAPGSIGTMLVRAEAEFFKTLSAVRLIAFVRRGKMHLTDGEIKFYQDGELHSDEHERIHSHLQACRRCREKSDLLIKQASSVTTHIESLNPSLLNDSTSLRTARMGMKKRILEKENTSMSKNIFNPKYRLAWITLAIVAIIAIAVAFPEVRAAANNFLGSFRVQQFTVVQFNPEDVQNKLGSSSHFEYMLSENVHIEENGDPFEVSDAAEASAMAGIPIRLPAGINESQQITVFPGASVTFDIDLSRVGMLLTEIGQGDIELPPELDGTQVSMELPTAVVAAYGDCQINSSTDETMGTDPDDPSSGVSNCTTLHQMVNPTISAPPELDVAQIGNSFLQLLGMSPEEAALFSETVDWTTTLLIPIPRHSTTYQEVTVDGVDATLILQQDYVPKFMLLWVKNDIVYALSGPGNSSTALEIANTLE